MAEFCYGCYKDILEGKTPEHELIISEWLELCEGCGEYKPIVIREKRGLRLLASKLFRR